MLTSMTGFGKASGAIENLDLVIEIKSVNSRYLELNVNLPKKLNFIEDAARVRLKELLNRGNIHCYVAAKENESTNAEYAVNQKLLDSFVKVMKKIGSETGHHLDVNVSDILSQPEIINLQDAGIDEKSFTVSFMLLLEDAVKAMVDMQQQEGINTEVYLQARIDAIQIKLDEIQALQKENVPFHLNLMKERVETLMESVSEEMSLRQELAQLADKLDINEEVERFNSHILQFNRYLQMQEPVGKRLNFILQEMNREITTMGNKANNSQISQDVVEIKNQLEAIREQVQNIQ